MSQLARGFAADCGALSTFFKSLMHKAFRYEVSLKASFAALGIFALTQFALFSA